MNGQLRVVERGSLCSIRLPAAMLTRVAAGHPVAVGP